MRSRPLLAVSLLLSSLLPGCFSFGECDEEKVLSCLEEACASGQLLDVTCACVAKGKTFDGDSCGCKDVSELTVCADEVVCSDMVEAATYDTEVSSCQGTCDQDFDCDLGEVCEVSTARCIPGCQFKSHCEKGQLCVEKQCVPGCEFDHDCDLPAQCNETTRQCDTACEGDDDCRLEARCDSDTCVERKACQRDTDCEGEPGFGICTGDRCR